MTTTAISTVATVGTYSEFLDALLSYESGIDPSQLAEYTSGGTTLYFEVERDKEGNRIPGRALRDDESGELQARVTMTYPEYFATLGIDFDWATENADNLAAARYQSVNFLGFIGFQVGEAPLISTGHYVPAERNGFFGTLPSYYAWTGQERRFAHGAEYSWYQIEGSSTQVYTTRNNSWEGTFTGKDGATSLAALRTRDVQEQVIRTMMQFNLNTLVAEFRRITFQPTTDEILIYQQILSRVVTKPSDPELSLVPSLSGLLAACHLRGAWGVAAVLTGTPDAGDETGTSVYDYCELFADYETVFDTPADDFSDTQSDPRDTFSYIIRLGWGNDKAVWPGARVGVYNNYTARHFYINRSWGTRTNLNNLGTPEFPDGGYLRLGLDKIVLDGYPESAGLGYDEEGNITGVTNGWVGGPAGPFEIKFAGQSVVIDHPLIDDAAAQKYYKEFIVIPRHHALTWAPAANAPQYLKDFRLLFDYFSPEKGLAISFDSVAIGKNSDNGRVTIGVFFDNGQGQVSFPAHYELAISDPDQLDARNFRGFSGNFSQVVRLDKHNCC